MALVSCRECKREVSSDAASCPHCGVADPAGVGAPATHTTIIEEKPKKGVFSRVMTWLGCLALAIVLVVLAVVFGLLDLIF